jgi:hypothetical protein
VPAIAPVPVVAGALAALFEPVPAEHDEELAAALALVRRIPTDCWFVRERVRCQKRCCEWGPTHGPYYRAVWKRDGKRCKAYVGGLDDVKRVLDAHARVRAYFASCGIKLAEAIKRPKRGTSRSMTPREVRAALGRGLGAPKRPS